MKAPFPYFGGKTPIADKVWAALGQPKHYIEPFFGSGAVLLSRRDYQAGKHVETVCDKDGYVANVWRGLQGDPEEVAKWCDWPVNHADLSARKKELIANEERLLENLIADPDWYDARLAGYWIWAASCWIGRGLTCIGAIPNVGKSGEGVHALSKIPHIASDKHVREPYNTNIYAWFRQLSERLRYVRVVCGDWTRVCGGNWQDKIGTVGVFFDPPYGVEDRDSAIYHHESLEVAGEVRAWALERGSKPTYRIVLAGYIEEHQELLRHDWTVEQWTTSGGYGRLGKGRGMENRHREALFYSPHCVQSAQPSLFE